MSESYVQKAPITALARPHQASGLVKWLRKEVFSSPLQAVGTFAGLSIAFFLVWTFVDFAILKAVWTGSDRSVCAGDVERPLGACWPFIWAKFGQLLYGFYPVEERWRVNLVYVITVALLVPLLVPRAPYKALNCIAFFGVLPVLAFVLLYGGSVFRPWFSAASLSASLAGAVALAVHLKLLNEQGGSRQVIAYGAILLAAAVAAWFVGTIPSSSRTAAFELILTSASLVALVEAMLRRKSGRAFWAACGCVLIVLGLVLAIVAANPAFAGPSLRMVPTAEWGGLFVTLVVAVTGIVASMPIGIALALARRSSARLVRGTAICFIEIVRGVPLITVLFFATYMLPLFLERSPDALLRVLIGVSLFAGAYMAETIRGGLQAIPKGQSEAAAALGLSYPQAMGLIVLPQALRLVIPGIVNIFIGLFKDTTLVSIVAIFDLLGGMRAAFTDPAWAGPSTLYTGFAFTGVIYFAFCYLMSSYSRWMEERLRVDHRS